MFGSGEAATTQGYTDGMKVGSEDGRKHKSFDPERSHYFKQSGYGNYPDEFRDGFNKGYKDGFNGK